MSPLNILNSTFDKKWTSYALAGGALFALPATGIAGPISLFSGDSDGLVQAPLDVDGDLVNDFNFFALGTPGSRDTSIQSIGGVNAVLVVGSPFGNQAVALGPGAIVGSGSGTFSSVGDIAFKYETAKSNPPPATKLKGKWANDINQTSYVGLQFLISGQTHYGWAAVSVQLGSATLHVTDSGYQTIAGADAVIPAPEPSSMALMLLGAAGVAALKKRRKNGEN